MGVNLKNMISFWLSNSIAATNNINPVSYTHLEIEKIIRQTKKKLKYEYPDRDTASSLILQDIFNMGDVRHREIEDIQGKPELKNAGDDHWADSHTFG